MALASPTSPVHILWLRAFCSVPTNPLQEAGEGGEKALSLQEAGSWHLGWARQTQADPLLPPN